MASRKRAAPGASPMTAQQSQTYTTPQNIQNISNNQSQNLPTYPNYSDGYENLSALANFDPNQINYASGLKMEPDAQYANLSDLSSAGQLVRRNGNNQLARQQNDAWDAADTTQANVWEEEEEEDDDDEDQLEQRALQAKKQTLARKGSIPPFVQKLSSFLDDPRNIDLIRWSEDGRSFIVLDEDEFARTLIPELFKHKNYASFVRQLNMYGFHKKVGLSDNSMKASENKRKTPSEYANPYFRRGRPELFWLIKKPKSNATKKGQDGVKDEEEQLPKSKGTLTQQSQATSSSANSKEMVNISKNEFEAMRQEVVQLKKQNQLISTVIQKLNNQNSIMHQQAAQFQAAQEKFHEQHERHEKSINAILTFLATFYNRSLEGQGQNLADMFAGKLGSNNQSGSIVDMTDLPEIPFDLQQLAGQNFNLPRGKRQLLLPAPKPSSSRQTPDISSRFETIDTPPQQFNNHSNLAPDVPSDILDIINAANANSPQPGGSTNFDFDSALAHMQSADGNTPLTDDQRQDMLDRLAQDTNTPLNTAIDTTGAAQPNASTTLASPSPPPFSVPSPNMQSILNRQNSLDFVQKLQQEQNQKVQELADRLGPLSPNGSIPGINDATLTGDFDFEDFLNIPSSNYLQPDNNTPFDPASNDILNFNDPAYTGLDGTDIGFTPQNFNLGTGASNSSHNRVQSVSSRGVSPATVATVEDEESGAVSSPRSLKRRRQN